MSINASVDINSVVTKIQNSAYGIEFICVITTIIVLVTCIYFLNTINVIFIKNNKTITHKLNSI